MKTWYDFYSDRMNDRYLEHVKTKYDVFISLVADSIPASGVAVEAGCGAGNVSRILCERRPDVNFHFLDNDVQMIGLTKKNLSQLGYPNYRVQYKDIDPDAYDSLLSDTIYPPGADVIYAHGVIEHYSDERIRRIIAAQVAAAKVAVVHYVPSYKYVTPSFGDERLMTKEQWIEVASPDTIYYFNDEYDYALMWYGRAK
jgi:precorrin-6B methylase 2